MVVVNRRGSHSQLNQLLLLLVHHHQRGRRRPHPGEGGGDFLIHVSNSLNQNLTLQRLYLPPSFFLLMALGHLKWKYLFGDINFNLPESFQNLFGRFDVRNSFCTCTTYLRTLDVLRGFEFHKRPE